MPRPRKEIPFDDVTISTKINGRVYTQTTFGLKTLEGRMNMREMAEYYTETLSFPVSRHTIGRRLRKLHNEKTNNP